MIFLSGATVKWLDLRDSEVVDDGNADIAVFVVVRCSGFKHVQLEQSRNIVGI